MGREVNSVNFRGNALNQDTLRIIAHMVVHKQTPPVAENEVISDALANYRNGAAILNKAGISVTQDAPALASPRAVQRAYDTLRTYYLFASDDERFEFRKRVKPQNFPEMPSREEMSSFLLLPNPAPTPQEPPPAQEPPKLDVAPAAPVKGRPK